MKRITIEPVSRIEGHAKITIQLDDQGHVSGTEFHVTQVRGFEKFTEGHPFYEMPGITARICGICPISHLLASSKACDAIMAVRIPPAAKRLRELVHYAQIVQSHALSFFYLSAPDFLLGMDSIRASRNVLGVIAAAPGPGARRDRTAQVRAADYRRTGAGTRASLVDRSRRRGHTSEPAQSATASSPNCRLPRRLPSAPSVFLREHSTTIKRKSNSSVRFQPCMPDWWMREETCSFTMGICVFGRRRRNREDHISADDYAHGSAKPACGSPI